MSFFLKIKDGGWRHTKKSKKLLYLINGLIDLHEIWYNDTEWVL